MMIWLKATTKEAAITESRLSLRDIMHERKSITGRHYFIGKNKTVFQVVALDDNTFALGGEKLTTVEYNILLDNTQRIEE